SLLAIVPVVPAVEVPGRSALVDQAPARSAAEPLGVAARDLRALGAGGARGLPVSHDLHAPLVGAADPFLEVGLLHEVPGLAAIPPVPLRRQVAPVVGRPEV